jgi:hypothetical protein
MCQNPPQYFIVAPLLEAPMLSLIVRIALWQHMPPSACVQNPQNRFQNATCRNRLSAQSSISNVLFRKMIPDALPLLVGQPNHLSFMADRH